MTDDLAGAGPEQLKSLVGSISTPAELRAVLDTPGVDDGLMDRVAAEAGVDALLTRLFSLMGTRFLPDAAAGRSGVVQWDVDTADGRRSYHLIIGDGKAEARPGSAEKPNTTLRMTLPNLLRLAGGRLNGVTGVMTGKIKISGDMMFAAAMQSWFDY